MNQSSASRLPNKAAVCPQTSRQHRWLAWAFLVLFLAACGVRAAGPDDDYTAIYILIDQGDRLVKSGNSERALAKYQEAQSDLSTFQQLNPTWNTKIVNFRLNYLAEKIAGLENKPAPTATASSSSSPKPSAASMAKKSAVKLLAEGAEPRTVLRLHPAVGDKQTMAMTMTMGMEMVMAGNKTPAVKIPAITLSMSTEVKDISKDGIISYDLVYNNLQMDEQGDSLPGVADLMKKTLAAFDGLTGTGKMSDRGGTTSMQIKMPANADPQLSQLANQMKDSISSSSMPLPDEPVGPGAKWEYKSRIKSQGINMDQTITTELVSIDGDQVNLKFTISQSAAKQKVQNPAMPGVSVDLTKLTGSGSGTSTRDLTHLLPASATINADTETSMSMKVGQQAQSMNMKFKINIAIESK